MHAKEQKLLEWNHNVHLHNPKNTSPLCIWNFCIENNILFHGVSAFRYLSSLQQNTVSSGIEFANFSSQSYWFLLKILEFFLYNLKYGSTKLKIKLRDALHSFCLNSNTNFQCIEFAIKYFKAHNIRAYYWWCVAG